MIPLRDNIPARRPPIMNWLLIGLNAAVFWLELSLPEETLHDLFASLGVVPARYALGEGVPPAVAWLAPLTSMFLHGGWFHVIANMWMLWIFGDNVEDRMGPVRFLVFYLTCGVVAALTHVWLNRGSPVPVVGASGAIAGVMGGYVLLFPRARVLTLVPILFLPFFFELSAVVFIGIWFAGQILSATWTLVGPEHGTGIAWWAHIGGFVTGLLLVKPLCGGRGAPRRLTFE